MADHTAGNDFHVIIIGAGISGLLLAQGLNKSGISFSIYEFEESAAYYRPREWGMSVQWGLPMLPEVLPKNLLDRLQSASVDPHYVFPETGNSMPVYDASTGEHMKDIPLVKMIRVSRRKFRALCADGIDVQYGKEIRTLRTIEDDSTVTAIFSDNTTATGNLIVGADGANSIIRSFIFPDGRGDSHQVPYSGINMHVCYGDADIARFLRKSLSPIQAIGVHPKGYWLWLSVQDVPDPEKPEGWTFQLQWTWKTGEDTASLAELDLTILKSEAQSLGEPYRTAWTKIPDGMKVPGNRVSVWAPLPIPEDVFKGKVALVGDAGHAMSFHRGQGMNHGIADAVKLTAVLGEVQSGEKMLKDAVDEYETEMIRRAGEEVAVSKMNTEMMHQWERLKQSPFMQRGGDKNK